MIFLICYPLFSDMAARVARLLSRSYSARSCLRRQGAQVTSCARYSTDPDHLAQFPGAKASYTENLDVLQPDVTNGIPIYRVMNQGGQVLLSPHWSSI